MILMDAAARFSGRALHYARSRPGYPQSLLDFLKSRTALTPAWVVADIGSGTGLSCSLFLDNGNTVYAVEPNAEMRGVAEESLGGYPNFHSRAGTAEATGLSAASVDMVTAGTAFHWFDAKLARREFERILNPGGWVALFWNVRVKNTEFGSAWEALLEQHAVDRVARIAHETEASAMAVRRFFAPNPVEEATFPNFQILDWEGMLARLISTSYLPAPGAPGFPKFHSEARSFFERFQHEGRVRCEYETRLYLGRLSAPECL